MDPIPNSRAIELYEWPDGPLDVGYELYLMYEESRGDLAFVPETMECYGCGGFDGHTTVERRVVRLGGVSHAMGFYPTGESVDPYQTYVLECGHVTI